MSEREPDFDTLVGDDLDADERERLHQVHELLVAAGPPPDAPTRSLMPTELASRRRRRPAVLALAAALGVAAGIAAFALGLAVGGSDGADPARVVAMEGSGAASGASASLAVYDADEAGNWPMELEVTGLAPSPNDLPYELWLTSGDRAYALCGSFRAEADGTTTVRMNAPYSLSDSAGWVVVEKGSYTPLLRT